MTILTPAAFGRVAALQAAVGLIYQKKDPSEPAAEVEQSSSQRGCMTNSRFKPRLEVLPEDTIVGGWDASPTSQQEAARQGDDSGEHCGLLLSHGSLVPNAPEFQSSSRFPKSGSAEYLLEMALQFGDILMATPATFMDGSASQDLKSKDTSKATLATLINVSAFQDTKSASVYTQVMRHVRQAGHRFLRRRKAPATAARHMEYAMAQGSARSAAAMLSESKAQRSLTNLPAVAKVHPQPPSQPRPPGLPHRRGKSTSASA
jgi:hypothetical protein